MVEGHDVLHETFLLERLTSAEGDVFGLGDDDGSVDGGDDDASVNGGEEYDMVDDGDGGGTGCFDDENGGPNFDNSDGGEANFDFDNGVICADEDNKDTLVVVDESDRDCGVDDDDDCDDNDCDDGSDGEDDKEEDGDDGGGNVGAGDRTGCTGKGKAGTARLPSSSGMNTWLFTLFILEATSVSSFLVHSSANLIIFARCSALKPCSCSPLVSLTLSVPLWQPIQGAIVSMPFLE